MFENKGPVLIWMTTPARLALQSQGTAAALHSRPVVHFVTVAAPHLPLRHRVMKRKAELPSSVQMTAIANLRRPVGIDNVASSSACLNVQAASSMARFTALAHCVWPLCHEIGVRGGPERHRDLLMTVGARL
jgi:hypothetical protein